MNQLVYTHMLSVLTINGGGIPLRGSWVAAELDVVCVGMGDGILSHISNIISYIYIYVHI